MLSMFILSPYRCIEEYHNCCFNYKCKMYISITILQKCNRHT